MSSLIRILLADDHAMVREGLAGLLSREPDLTLVGECGTAADALRLTRSLRPDVLVLDIGLPDENGLDLCPRIREAAPDTRIVVLTMYDDPLTVTRAFAEGASGFVVKGGNIAALTVAIRAAAAGQRHVSPEVARGHDDVPAERLTPRETEILALVAAGMTSRRIAEQLGLAVKTVRNHRANLMDKLGIRTTAGLVRYALERGIGR